jgi:hypothetical protein
MAQEEWQADIEAALRTLNRVLTTRMPTGAKLEAEATGRTVVIEVETKDEIQHFNGAEKPRARRP